MLHRNMVHIAGEVGERYGNDIRIYSSALTGASKG